MYVSFCLENSWKVIQLVLEMGKELLCFFHLKIKLFHFFFLTRVLVIILSLIYSLEVLFLHMHFMIKILCVWKCCGVCPLFLCVRCYYQKLRCWEKMCYLLLSEKLWWRVWRWGPDCVFKPEDTRHGFYNWQQRSVLADTSAEAAGLPLLFAVKVLHLRSFKWRLWAICRQKSSVKEFGISTAPDAVVRELFYGSSGQRTGFPSIVHTAHSKLEEVYKMLEVCCRVAHLETMFCDVFSIDERKRKAKQQGKCYKNFIKELKGMLGLHM